MYDPTSGNAIVDKKGCETYFFIDQLEEDIELHPQQIPDGKEICTVNRVDFSHLGLDEVYETLLVDQPQVANSSGGSDPGDTCDSESFAPPKSCKDPIEKHDLLVVGSCGGTVPGCSCNNENFEPSISRRGDPIEKEETIRSCSGNIPNIGQIPEGTGMELCSDSINKQHEDSFASYDDNAMHEIAQSADKEFCNDLNNRPMTSLSFDGDNLSEKSLDEFVARNVYHSGEETVKNWDVEHLQHKKEPVASSKCKNVDNIIEAISFVRCGPEAGGQVGVELVALNPTHCETISECKISKADVMIQSTSEADLVIRRCVISGTNTSSAESLAVIPLKNFLKRRMGDSTFNSRASKLQKILEPFSETKAKEKFTVDCNLATSDPDSETIAGNSLTGKADSPFKANPDVKYPGVPRDADTGHCSPKVSHMVEFDNYLSGRSSPDISTLPRNFSWTRYYASPLETTNTSSDSIQFKPKVAHKVSRYHKSLHMKFPKDFKLPTVEELQKKLSVFGPLDCLQTKVYFYTGAAEVVFLHGAHAAAAYKYVKRANIFGDANVRFWFDRYESSRKHHRQHSTLPPKKRAPYLKKSSNPRKIESPDEIDGNGKFSISSEKKSPGDSCAMNIKPCLRSPDMPRSKDKNVKVRFKIETPCRQIL